MKQIKHEATVIIANLIISQNQSCLTSNRELALITLDQLLFCYRSGYFHPENKKSNQKQDDETVLLIFACMHKRDNAACFFEKGAPTKIFYHRSEGVSLNPLKMKNLQQKMFFQVASYFVISDVNINFVGKFYACQVAGHAEDFQIYLLKRP